MIEIAALSLVLLLALIALGIPIALALAVVGMGGMLMITNINAVVAQSTSVFWSDGTNFLLLSLPGYVLMGNLVNHTGIASKLYRCMTLWLNWLPGGLGVASVFACAGFGAVCGSSPATARTMGSIVVPAMRERGYNMSIATGVVSSSGTLGILIPPSITFIFYGIMTETSIGKLFLAGVLPGVLTALVFASIMLAVAVLRPGMVEKRLPEHAISWSERFAALAGALPVFALFVGLILGLYGGVFTPTEGSAVGVSLVLLYGLAIRTLTLESLRLALRDSVLTSTMILLIIIGGVLYTRFIAQTGFSREIVSALLEMELSQAEFMLLVTIIFFALGCVLDVFGMIILTVPFIFPMVLALGIDPIWFGVYVVIIAEVALITPPIGVNVYVIKSVAPDVPLNSIFRGCLPFLLGEIVIIAALYTFPDIALFLVR